MTSHVQDTYGTQEAVGLDDELALERAYVAMCREAMTRQVDDAQYQVVAGEGVSGDGASAEALGRYLRTRARQMAEEPDSPLFFGRLDFEDTEDAGDHRRQRYYIGRRRVSEHPAAPPLVIDWRAPVSRTYYQASALEPRGVAVRRRFGWAPWSHGAPEDLTGLEDEHLDHARDEGDGDAASAIVAAEIERPRLGPMRDIVATIQPEQDNLVRSELNESVCVQGAPGSGKTAVGLHRAAFLLYTFPERLQRSGLLIIGPNRTFLRYISEVLPSLGEIDIAQLTVEDVVARHPVKRVDGEDVGVLKHSDRMATVLERALYARVRHPEESIAVTDGSYRWRVDSYDLARVIDEVRGMGVPYGVGREHVRSRVVTLIQQQAERRAGPKSVTWARKIGRSKPVAALLEAAWPVARPEEVVAALLSDPSVMEEAADGVFDAAEQRALLWAKPPRSEKSATWSVEDMLLLDEVAGLIERPEGFGHVVVDEAQDLSPMQCRAIARRSAFGSITVLGDLAQATAPWSARSWQEQLTYLGKAQATVVPLTTGFRVPAAVMELANRLVGALGVDVPPARSLRHDGELTVSEVDDAAAATVSAVRAALDREGSVAVIAADDAVAATSAALREAGIETATADAVGTAARVTVLPATVVKGLEYDHVVVVEPTAIVESEARGLHRLYVVVTRAVSRLDVLHARPLPEPLVA
ncbi:MULTISPECIES: HelD family protein [Streptomyces]|uniref:HelD family protein n=2 Tax=Streptomyces TaxID=1883 RepID=UPI00081B3EEB|nr:DNA helicase IV [Streptomyces sp. PalvLS-984]SDD22261.1 DNA helicase IV [Streptomyces sp. AmelKG-A3]